MSKSKKRNPAWRTVAGISAAALLLWLILSVGTRGRWFGEGEGPGHSSSRLLRPAPVTLERVARVSLPEARTVVIDGHWAWVGQNLTGMTLLDVSTPIRPRVARSFAPEDVQALAVTMAGPRLLAIGDRFRGLRLWDVSTPTQPTELSTLLLPGLATHLEHFESEFGKFIAVAAGAAGLVLVDITEPARPAIASHCPAGADFSRQVRVSDGLAFVADHANGGLKLFDVSSPATPGMLIKVGLSGFCESVTSGGNHIYVGYRNSGIRVFEMHPSADDHTSTPSLELLCALYRSQTRVRDLELLEEEQLLAVADDEAGVVLYDVAVPQLPVVAAEYRYLPEDGAASAVVADHGFLYVPSWKGGLSIFLVQVLAPPG